MSELKPCPELNLNNYNEDDVAELNAWAVDAAIQLEHAEYVRNRFVDILQPYVIRGATWEAIWERVRSIALKTEADHLNNRPESEAERAIVEYVAIDEALDKPCAEWTNEECNRHRKASQALKDLARKLAGGTTTKGE